MANDSEQKTPTQSQDDLEDDEMFYFNNLQEVYDYMRISGIQLSDQDLRVIAAGISYRAAWKGISVYEDLHKSACPNPRFKKLIPVSEPTIKARFLKLIGRDVPFDRHDYLVDRCGTEVRYIVEFYANGTHDFVVDARPHLTTAGVVDRFRVALSNSATYIRDLIRPKPSSPS
eukprot:TRINITY_DN6573_c0_g4_i1.p1 TRINITY_DN6573_c0_g4~~TRINITY_DN6573_c0_g4_i1.p1  ORF type:complete len:184 (+),score=20.14 TRINITY_DN6573_c0_g4_i1:36-554(+)